MAEKAIVLNDGFLGCQVQLPPKHQLALYLEEQGMILHASVTVDLPNKFFIEVPGLLNAEQRKVAQAVFVIKELDSIMPNNWRDFHLIIITIK